MIESLVQTKVSGLVLEQLRVVAYLFLLEQTRSADSLAALLPVCTSVNSAPVSPEKSQQNSFELFLFHLITQREDTD